MAPSAAGADTELDTLLKKALSAGLNACHALTASLFARAEAHLTASDGETLATVTLRLKRASALGLQARLPSVSPADAEAGFLSCTVVPTMAVLHRRTLKIR